MEEKKQRPKQEYVPGYKSKGQKLKSLLVIQYILKNADEETPVSMEQIQAHLAKYGIEAERRSIYRDIADYMKLLEREQDGDIEDGEA